LDKLTMLIQEAEASVSRSLRYPIGDVASPVIDDKATRAGKFLAFDIEGEPVSRAGTAGDPSSLTKPAGAVTGNLIKFGSSTEAVDSGTTPEAIQASAEASANAYTDTAVGSLTGSVLNSSVATTSGTFIDFLNIPAWAKRVTLQLVNVGVDEETSLLNVLMGDASSFETTEYAGVVVHTAIATLAVTRVTSDIRLTVNDRKAEGAHGVLTLTLVDAGTNTWMAVASIAEAAGRDQHVTSTTFKSLTGPLTRLRLTKVGVANFDSGFASITWE